MTDKHKAIHDFLESKGIIPSSMLITYKLIENEDLNNLKSSDQVIDLMLEFHQLHAQLEDLPVQQWLVENKDLLNLSSLEKSIGCPATTLQKVVKEGRSLPKKWEAPLQQVKQRMCGVKHQPPGQGLAALMGPIS